MEGGGFRNPVEIIRRKRDGGVLTREELRWFISGCMEESIPRYQLSAFLMAVFFRGMTDGETAALTEVMLHSGTVVDLSALPGLKVDKHSTGGVGDKVSLILAPMVAACGVPVPMISGRGLGHTGGTLDKLESIPGFRTALSLEEYRRVIGETGLVLIGQTDEIAPADRMMYALRDVTATVESIPLIAGSIMSKKLAEGIDALVLDVKFGSGAFMHRYEDALALARALVGIGNAMGTRTLGFLTSMEQPLGAAIGNWLEVREAADCLQGKPLADLMEVTLVLGGAMVYAGGKAASIGEGMEKCREAVRSGRAWERFLAVVKAQGGDTAVLLRPGTYPFPRHSIGVPSPRDGYVAGFRSMALGLLGIELGAGRTRVEEGVDPKAGILLLRKRGDAVGRGETLARLFTDRDEAAARASQAFLQCVEIGDAPPPPEPLIRSFLDGEGVRPWSPPTPA
ncbi:MAG: thymidine phosphorylase [Bacteroidota bacterium]